MDRRRRCGAAWWRWRTTRPAAGRDPARPPGHGRVRPTDGDPRGRASMARELGGGVMERDGTGRDVRADRDVAGCASVSSSDGTGMRRPWAGCPGGLDRIARRPPLLVPPGSSDAGTGAQKVSSERRPYGKGAWARGRGVRAWMACCCLANGDRSLAAPCALCTARPAPPRTRSIETDPAAQPGVPEILLLPTRSCRASGKSGDVDV